MRIYLLGMHIDILWLLLTWLHMMAAVIWIGGLFYAGAVLLPQKSRGGPTAHQLNSLGLQRFRLFVWSAVVTLVLTGVATAAYRVWTPQLLWTTPWGVVLLLKLVLVAVLAYLTMVSLGHPLRRLEAMAEGEVSPPELLHLQGLLRALLRRALFLGAAVVTLSAVLARI